MGNITEASQKSEYIPKLLFKLEPYFAQDEMDLFSQDFFPANGQIKFKSDRLARYDKFPNIYIENEFKGFVQHLALDLHYAAATLKQYITASGRMILRFLNEYYPNIYSIIQFDYEFVYNRYLEFLVDQGLVIYSNSIVRVNKDMQQTKYSSKSVYLSGFAHYYKYIYAVVYPNKDSEYDKDTWDIRNLGIPYDTLVSRQRFTVNFTQIKQPFLRVAAKEYTYYRLQHRTVAAVLDDIKALNIFSSFLDQCDSGVKAVDEIDRSTIEEYIAFLNQKGFAATTFNRRLSALRTFFITGNMLDMERFPTKPLILYSDYRKIVHSMPKYFTDFELKQMNSHISDLPIQVARMFFILENCGMRVSDICSSPIYPGGRHCLSKNSKGEYLFKYLMPKSHRYNVIPITEIVGSVIEQAISDSQEKYGKECKYIFASSASTAMSVENFSLHMNQMSHKYQLKRDDGSPLRIKGHTFRGTIATRYANCGINMDVIRLMLGQQKLGVLNHYVQIHGETMVSMMKPITDEDDLLIRSIGKDDPTTVIHSSEPSLIPLPNGRCSKDISTGVCCHAYQCYSCRMFRPTIDHLPLYQMQLQEAERNIEIAKIHGFDRILELNEDLRDCLIKIINRIEVTGGQNG